MPGAVLLILYAALLVAPVALARSLGLPAPAVPRRAVLGAGDGLGLPGLAAAPAPAALRGGLRAAHGRARLGAGTWEPAPGSWRCARAADGVTVGHVLGEPPPGWTGETGQVDGRTIAAAFAGQDGAEGWIYLMCGPPAMLDSAEAALTARGVPASRIVGERFTYD